ncbi:conserved hypothetical protein [Ricinus communis]|uniref:Uncharacterized protein n=1 Tax=Ricinus communis TaxID=3988 RepID=B9TQD5_RICCO|nr:conserved hypothetical protein [Ricinus communis]
MTAENQILVWAFNLGVPDHVQMRRAAVHEHFLTRDRRPGQPAEPGIDGPPRGILALAHGALEQRLVRPGGAGPVEEVEADGAGHQPVQRLDEAGLRLRIGIEMELGSEQVAADHQHVARPDELQRDAQPILHGQLEFEIVGAGIGAAHAQAVPLGQHREQRPCPRHMPVAEIHGPKMRQRGAARNGAGYRSVPIPCVSIAATVCAIASGSTSSCHTL